MTGSHEAKPFEYWTVSKAVEETGLSEGAIRKRMLRGIWLEGQHWKRDPMGRIWIIREGIKAWVETAAA